MQYKLSELIARFGGVLIGDDHTVSGIAPTNMALSDQITFLTENKYKKDLLLCNASAVILREADAMDASLQDIKMSKIITDEPYLYFARVSQLFNPKKRLAIGIKSSSVRGDDVIIGDGAAISDFVSLGNNVVIGSNCQIYPHVVIGDDVVIGDNVIIYPNVSIYANVKIGNDCIFHSGSVIGSDGFGNASDKHKKWHKIPQIGGVVIGDKVEIGANTTVDCGTFAPTVIGDGVVIDNLVQVAHNVTIGAHTGIAACVGIAGNATIGKHCLIAGGAGVNGHISIADHTVIGGAAGVVKTITEPNYYAGVFPIMPFKEWAKNAVHLKRLNEMYKAIKALEKQIHSLSVAEKIEEVKENDNNNTR